MTRRRKARPVTAEERTWLDSLTVGSEVVINGGWSQYLGKVIHEDGIVYDKAKELIVEFGHLARDRFRRDDGRTENMHHSISQPTAEERDGITRRDNIHAVQEASGSDWNRLSNEQLNAVAAMLREAK